MGSSFRERGNRYESIPADTTVIYLIHPLQVKAGLQRLVDRTHARLDRGDDLLDLRLRRAVGIDFDVKVDVLHLNPRCKLPFRRDIRHKPADWPALLLQEELHAARRARAVGHQQ